MAWQEHEPSRSPLHGPERQVVHATQETATDPPRGRGRAHGGDRRPDRRWPDRDRARQGPAPGIRQGRRIGPAVRAGHPLLGDIGARRAQDGARVVADGGAARRGDPGATESGPVHGPRAERHRGGGRRGQSRAARIRTPTSRRSRRTSTPATTTCTSTRSGRTRRASSTSLARNCFRASGRGRRSRSESALLSVARRGPRCRRRPARPRPP